MTFELRSNGLKSCLLRAGKTPSFELEILIPASGNIFRSPERVIIFRFAPYPNHFYIHHCPTPQRGVSRSSRTRSGMWWTRQRYSRAAPKRTAKSCAPDAPTLVSSWRSFPLNDGGKKARSPGEHEANR